MSIIWKLKTYKSREKHFPFVMEITITKILISTSIFAPIIYKIAKKKIILLLPVFVCAKSGIHGMAYSVFLSL